jgi:hypothetical protein
MVGSTYRWQILAVLTLCGAGCVGPRDTPPDRPRTPFRPSQQAADPPAPNLRLPADPTPKAGSDIPIVPVPPPPIARSAQPQTSPSPSPQQTPAPPAQATPTNSSPPSAVKPQADGSQPAPVPTAPPQTAKQLMQQASARCATLNSYIVRLTRREFLKGKSNPEEILLFKFRKQPFSVHFKWLGETAKGREVVYVKGRYDNKIHTKLAAGDAPLMPAGTRWSVSPDSALARSASRHPITNAGIGHCVETLSAQLDAQEHGDRRQGTITVLPPQRRPEYAQPVETIQRDIPPGIEPELPRGGRRMFYFDPDWRLPMLVITYDDTGREVEYYRYDRMQAPLNLDDDDFNPDKLWAAPRSSPTPAGAPRP